MEADRWQRIKTLVADALELTADERRLFLQKACADDEQVRQRVEALLELEETAAAFMARPPVVELSADDLPGHPERVGRYRITRKIATGGGRKMDPEAIDTYKDRRRELRYLKQPEFTDEYLKTTAERLRTKVENDNKRIVKINKDIDKIRRGLS